jgi:hypothetical protein
LVEDKEVPTAVRTLHKLYADSKRSCTPTQMAALSQEAIKRATMHAMGHPEDGVCDDCPVCQMTGNTGT